MHNVKKKEIVGHIDDATTRMAKAIHKALDLTCENEGDQMACISLVLANMMLNKKSARLELQLGDQYDMHISLASKNGTCPCGDPDCKNSQFMQSDAEKTSDEVVH